MPLPSFNTTTQQQIEQAARLSIPRHTDFSASYDSASGWYIRCFDCDAVWTVTGSPPSSFQFRETFVGDESDQVVTAT